MPVDDQPVPEPAGTHQGPTEALRQIARDMAKAYEVALEVNPQLYFSGRTPAVASTHTAADRA